MFFTNPDSTNFFTKISSFCFSTRYCLHLPVYHFAGPLQPSKKWNIKFREKNRRFRIREKHVMNLSIDLDSNDGMVQTVTDEQLPDPITAAQPKGRLRIINQPDGPLTENIHDLKSSSVSVSGQTNLETHPSGPNGTSVSANAFINWMPNTNNLCSLASLDQQQHTVVPNAQNPPEKYSLQFVSRFFKRYFYHFRFRQMDELYIQHSLNCCRHNFKLSISPNFSFQFLAGFLHLA